MNEGHPTRREALVGLAATHALASVVKAQPASSVCFTSTVEMARLIRTKKLSAREALAEHLKQIERVNPKVNAIVTLVPEMAAEAAGKADEMQARKEKLGPLHGLPVAHKDLMETRGIRTTYGSSLYKDYIPTEDDLIVERVRRAGAITVGKTNTPEFGAGSQTFNKVFGATLNPYDLTKTCGGSSGVRRSRLRADWCQWPRVRIRVVPCAIPRHSATWWASGLRLAAYPIRKRRSRGRP